MESTAKEVKNDTRFEPGDPGGPGRPKKTPEKKQEERLLAESERELRSVTSLLAAQCEKAVAALAELCEPGRVTGYPAASSQRHLVSGP
jgi:hypothetical protein